ncbi:MAG: GAF domain-containing sensor histidine kinase [Melioribacteraceae bacterium]|nr:GAF domain-containing sensor histidine kinase [Melioribacteraceae bacterium]
MIDKHDTSIEEDTSPYEEELKEDKFQKVHSEELPEDQVEQNIEETEHLAEEPLFTEDDDDEISIETEKDIKKDFEEEENSEVEDSSSLDDETLKALESQDEAPEEETKSKQKYNDFDEAFFSAFSEEEKQAEEKAKSQKDDADFDSSQEEDSFVEPTDDYTPHDAEEYISKEIDEKEIVDDTKELDKLDEHEPEEAEVEVPVEEDKHDVEETETAPPSFESRLNSSSESGLKSDQFKKIIKALQLVNSNIRIDEVLKNIVTVATDLTNADRGTLYLIDKENNELWSKIAMGSETKEIRLKMGEGIAGWVAQNRETVNIEDVSKDDRFKSDVDRSSGYETKSMLCFPIKDREDQIVGVLQLLNSKNGKFGEHDEEFLSAISIQCSLALQNAEMLEKFLQGERVSSLGKMTNFLIQDIKKPVLVSKRYAEHLKTKELNKDADQIVEMILEQLTQVADLVQTTSSYAEGKSVLRTSRVGLNETLKEYSERLESYVKTRNVQIENQFADDVKVQLDSKEFFQCYNHIIRNACDAMPEGGVVKVSTHVDKNEAKILFEDNGLGIPESMVEKIFEPFMTHGKKEGTGLGLTITKKIVESHSGKIEVQSALGEGTKVKISLPRSSAF